MAKTNRKRSIRHEITLSESEEEILNHKLSLIREYNPKMSFNNYFIELMLNGHIIINDTVNLKALFDELNRIGVNINQIAKRVNEREGFISNSDVNLLKNEFDDIKNIIIKNILSKEI